MPPTKRQRLGRKTAKAVSVKSARATENEEITVRRQAGDRKRLAQRIANETPEKRHTRLDKQASRTAASRAHRSRSDATRKARARLVEPVEQKSSHMIADAKRKTRQLCPTKRLWHCSAFHYDPKENYAERQCTAVGSMQHECKFCQALKYPGEALGLCCNNGTVLLNDFQGTPEPLLSLLQGQLPESQHFLNNLRSYNAAFQMTSFGHERRKEGNYMPTFRIQGQVYHRIGSLLPMDGDEHRFIQIYFMGDSVEEASQRAKVVPGTKVSVLLPLQDMLHTSNRYVREFKSALQRLEAQPQSEQSYRIVIRADRTPASEHKKCYNRPETEEVAVLIAGHDEITTSRDIVLETRDSQLQRISELHPWYDALQYPLLFPCAEDGYHINIFQVDPASRCPTAKKVSAMAFYAYRLMMRNASFNRLHRGRMLLNQYMVDMYAKVESERLNFIRHHQRQLRAENYVNLKDAVNRQTATNDQVSASDIGQAVILPSSFTGGPRYMHERTQDALTYVRKYGRPDLFITFTCNPNWEEITASLLEQQKPDQRHDLIARLFHQKLKKMMQLFTSGCLFGNVICYMYTVEWQKRGLPHTHILLWLQQKLRSTDIDAVISAEFPDPDQDPVLFEVIKKHMVHGPCGDLNRNSKCMENGKCTKRYPRQMLQETQTGEDGYPLYRRRKQEDGGFTTKLRIHSTGDEVDIDNSWVVPHNRLLCKLFQAHINVEYCNSVKAIKYICKYVNKGSDRAVFEVKPTDTHRQQPRDEVTQFQSGRYISTNEAAWRIFDFPIHARYPPVEHLSVHLENGQRVYFTQQNVANRAAEPPRTTLTAFFDLCKEDSFARRLLYCDVPQYYTWNSSKRMWQRRKQGRPVLDEQGIRAANTLGRVYTVHPMNFECFCLRLLLHVVKGPTSFQDLRTVDGHVCATFKEACSMRELLEDDQHWDKTLEEAAASHSPIMLRQLFAIMLVYCNLANPAHLWAKHKDDLSEDVLLQTRRNAHEQSLKFTDDIYNQGLIMLEDKVLEVGGRALHTYGMVAADRSRQHHISRHMLRETSYDLEHLQKYVDDNEPLLTPDQAAAYKKVLHKVASGTGSILFLDAPGGTGKTFLLNLILAKVRHSSKIALAVASSGIAATLLTGGRTAHSAFKLPLNLCHHESPVCNINKGTDEANVLEQSCLIVWDEATMSHKNALHALDKSLKDIRSSSLLLGGIVLLLAGDFRQTLPIIPKGTPADEINACLKSSYLWRFVETMQLTTNMRVRLLNDTTGDTFPSTLLQIGNGLLPQDEHGCISISDIGQFTPSQEELCDKVYPDLRVNFTDQSWLCERAVLAPTNETVSCINRKLLRQIPGEERCYRSVDTITEPDQVTQYPTEFLNSLEPPGLPPHNLYLKLGCPIMLLRNLDAPKLCNGTRLIVKQMMTHIIEAVIMTGQGKGQPVFIPRIPLIPSDCPFPFKRLQFPVRPCFAITINKAQGQSLKVAGIHLETPCFSHGQLYVACSRVGKPDGLFIHASDCNTRNVVYPAVLQ